MQLLKTSYLSVLLVLIAVFTYGQNQPTPHTVMHSGEYLWGKGRGATMREADNSALMDLISQISVEVEGYFKNIKIDSGNTVKDYTKSVVKTYSNTSLQDARRQVLDEDRQGHTVLRYITKKEMEKIFASRREKLVGYWQLGRSAEEDLRIGDALKNYYWALTLLRSHPGVDTIKKTLPGYDGKMQLKQILFDKIEQILSNLDFTVESIIHNEKDRKKVVALDIRYDNQPVTNIDYEYYTGDGFSSLTTAKNGCGEIKLYDASAQALSKVDLYVEYQYKNKAKYDHELERVMGNVGTLSFNRSQVTLNVTDEPEQKKIASNQLQKSKIRFNESLTLEKPDTYIKRTLNVVEGIQNRIPPTQLKEAFTEEGFGMFEKLISQGNVSVMFADTSALKVVEVNKEIIVRAIPMSFDFKSNSKDFIEEVVFTYNKEGKIDALSFSISQAAIDDIVSKSEKWASQEEKYLLVQFLEYYKTAYCLKRLDYIKSIFDDNALIIVGHVLREDEGKSLDRMYSDLDQERVEYIRLSKNKYMDRLASVFSTNEFININFEDNEISRLNDDKIYGIQINQNYHSTNYADQGYLFLMVDLKDTLNPRIYVRSWQPKKYDDGTIIGLKNFHF